MEPCLRLYACRIIRRTKMNTCTLQGNIMKSALILAYLDPGTGSMLLQAIVGGSAGLMVLIRHFWRTARVSRKPLEPNPSGIDA